MAWYSGECVGGPHGGKQMHHPEPRFELVKRLNRRVQAYQPGYELAEGEVRGAYVHDGERWEWTR